jgi:16S rRNA (cytidine1402-2'-O)-methyltransferase
MAAPGTLFVVATPIGNLEDITQRALRVLGEVAVVAAEDTRRTRNLLRHYNINTPLISVHEHNEWARLEPLIARLGAGESIALVSDAGTPGISDPGSQLVNAARAGGIRVDPVPGPSAVTAALSASGLAADRFAFGGFPPIRSNDRREWFDWVARLSDIPVVCFEAPHRIKQTLADCRAMLGKRPIILVRELTKVHEQWLFGDPLSVSQQLSENRGEFLLIFCPHQTMPEPLSEAQIVEVFGRITKTYTGSRRDAIQQTAAILGISRKAVYEAIERAKLLGERPQ